jgi:Ca2+-binding RTX toxin-like protein
MRKVLRVTAAALLGTALLAPVVFGEAHASTLGSTEWVMGPTGATWAQVAAVCPTDGATPCNGVVAGQDITGWVWATEAQARDLMDDYAPELATVDSVGGQAYWMAAAGFVGFIGITGYQSLTYSYSEWTYGWTASKRGDLPVGIGASWSHPFFNGGLGIGALADVAHADRGVVLWRTIGGDTTSPVISVDVTGTLGSNGWYVSDVGVSWTVTDPESAFTTTGCEPGSVTTDTDDAGVTFSCSATNGVTPLSSATVSIKRDATAPSIACAAAVPSFGLGTFASISANVTDDGSGPWSPTVTSSVSTATAGTFSVALTGYDQAGNAASVPCSYQVTMPTCGGLAPTIVGTGSSETIRGTSKRDVIHALGGSDTVYGEGGDDIICGGDGNDNLNGGAGNDTLDGGAGSDSIRGDDGADRCTSGEVRMSSCAVIY